MNRFFRVIVAIFSTILLSYQLQAEEKITNNDTYLIDKIVIDGIENKNNKILIDKIIEPFLGKELSFKDFKIIRDKINTFYIDNGELFVKIIIPKQDISDAELELLVVKGKVDRVYVEGNKYYSSDFITKGFSLKKGDLLDHDKMIESLLMLNDYTDLSVKSFPKKGTDFATADILLQVEDEKPFHFTATYDNLGSKSTSKNRATLSLFHGNTITDGDEIDLSYTLGLKQSNTKLLRTNYAFRVGNKHTKISMGYLKANYVAAGDFSILDIKGDTQIYTLGITQPFTRSMKNRVDLAFNYSYKNIKNYLLGSLSSEDKINTLNFSGLWQYVDVYNAYSLNANLSKGVAGYGDFGSRVDVDINFLKFNLSQFYSRYITDTNSLLISMNAQYSGDHLPVVEMFSIGGLGSVRGYEPSVGLGDSGYTLSTEWNYKPKFENKLYADSLQLALFVDHGKIFINDPVPGQEKNANLTGAGVYIKANYEKKYFVSLTVGVPIHSSTKIIDEGTTAYVVVDMKLW